MITSEFGRISLLWAVCAMFDDFKFSFRYLSLFLFNYFFSTTHFTLDTSIDYNTRLHSHAPNHKQFSMLSTGLRKLRLFLYARGPDFGHSIFCSICYYTLFFIALFLLSLFSSYFCFKHYVAAVFCFSVRHLYCFTALSRYRRWFFGIRTEKIALFLIFRCYY